MGNPRTEASAYSPRRAGRTVAVPSATPTNVDQAMNDAVLPIEVSYKPWVVFVSRLVEVQQVHGENSVVAVTRRQVLPVNHATGAVAFSDPTERLPSWGGGSLIDEGSPPSCVPAMGTPTASSAQGLSQEVRKVPERFRSGLEG